MAIIYRTELLEAALKKLCARLAHIKGAVIVSIEGFVIAAFPTADPQTEAAQMNNGSINSPQVAAMAATLIALGERTLTRLAQGELGRLMLEGSEGAMLVVPVSKQAAVALLVENSAKMGLSLYALKRTAAEIHAILERE